MLKSTSHLQRSSKEPRGRDASFFFLPWLNVSSSITAFFFFFPLLPVGVRVEHMLLGYISTVSGSWWQKTKYVIIKGTKKRRRKKKRKRKRDSCAFFFFLVTSFFFFFTSILSNSSITYRHSLSFILSHNFCLLSSFCSPPSNLFVRFSGIKIAFLECLFPLSFFFSRSVTTLLISQPPAEIPIHRGLLSSFFIVSPLAAIHAYGCLWAHISLNEWVDSVVVQVSHWKKKKEKGVRYFFFSELRISLRHAATLKLLRRKKKWEIDTRAFSRRVVSLMWACKRGLCGTSALNKVVNCAKERKTTATKSYTALQWRHDPWAEGLCCFYYILLLFFFSRLSLVIFVLTCFSFSPPCRR